MKYIIVALFGVFLNGFLFAQNLEIIPELDAETKEEVGTDVVNIGKGGKVWDEYNKKASEYQSEKDLAKQMASGVFTWETILDYLAYLVKFMSEVGIFVGASFIVYAGYIYATSIFGSSDVSKGKTAIKNAIIGVIVITFSYAIMKAITAAFLT